MIKSILLAGVILLNLVSYAKAETEMADVVNSTMTATVSVSSSTATTMDSTCVASRKGIEIQNQSASANLWCDYFISPTTSTGRKIAPGASWFLGLRCYNTLGSRISVKCVNDSGSAASNAFVSQVGNK